MNVKDFKIGTIGSHSALQILKGAHDEGFQTVVICERGRTQAYRSYKVADTILEVHSLKEASALEQQLVDDKVVLIPHGSFFSAFGIDQLMRMRTMYFGNRNVLPLEESRLKQREWMTKAGVNMPRIYKKPEDIVTPAIIKFYGAGGGRGYFLTHSPEDFARKIKPHAGKKYVIQEYVVGTPLYVHYFYSPLTGELEVMGMDKRYESNVDSIGRISASEQLELGIESSYTIVGNIPIVVRESLLPEIFAMGQKVVDASKKLTPRGLFGPFCLEMIVTPELEFYVFEISARIVAGTNPYIQGSPYSALRYDEPMSTGRRIAREIKLAIEQGRLEEVLCSGKAG